MKKTYKANAGKADAPETPNPAHDPAQQKIWLAGLGAFAKAHEEGGRMFEALVKEGIARQRKTQAEAQQKLSEATQRIGALASGLTAQAARPWGGLENIFEDRVAKALNVLGVPSSRDLDAIAVRLDALERRVQALSGADGGAPRGAAKTSAKTAGKKTAPKRAAARKTAS